MLSLVIPCYNCASYIDGHIEKMRVFLGRHFPDFEIILVDDGSRDDTPERLRAWSASDSRIHALILPSNRGKGAAVKAGVLASRGDIVIFTDADLPYDLSAIPVFVKVLGEGSDVILGSRKDDGEVRGQKIHRTHLSRLFAACASLALSGTVPDTQAGIKGFTARAAKEIFPHVTIARFGFDVEVIAIAQYYKMKITNVPVLLINQAPSTVHVGRDGLRMGLDIVYVFLKYRLLGGLAGIVKKSDVV